MVRMQHYDFPDKEGWGAYSTITVAELFKQQGMVIQIASFRASLDMKFFPGKRGRKFTDIDLHLFQLPDWHQFALQLPDCY